jgi:hypothetical protein
MLGGIQYTDVWNPLLCYCIKRYVSIICLVNMSHGENKLTPRDNRQHVFVAIYHSEEDTTF